MTNIEKKNHNIKAVIFDLDGTLLDTLEDLADAANFALRTAGLKERTLSEIRDFVGTGIRNLVLKSVYGEFFVNNYGDTDKLNIVPENEKADVQNLHIDDKTFEVIMNNFKQHYEENLMNKTHPFPGVLDMLKRLNSNGYKIAVVSNKYNEAVKKLCRHYFGDLVQTAVGIHKGVDKKPSADMVNEVLREIVLSKENVIYVGDSEVDVKTAQNAEVECLSCTWGFRSSEELKTAGASHLIDTCENLYSYL